LDATTIGAVLAFVGVVSGSVVAYIGKRGENSVTRFNSVTDQVQEDNATLREQLSQRDVRIGTLQDQRQSDLEQITRLRIKVIQLGGDPDQ
jgi:U3 small nucleolar RNA-associated protein 14